VSSNAATLQAPVLLYGGAAPNPNPDPDHDSDPDSNLEPDPNPDPDQDPNPDPDPNPTLTLTLTLNLTLAWPYAYYIKGSFSTPLAVEEELARTQVRFGQWLIAIWHYVSWVDFTVW